MYGYIILYNVTHVILYIIYIYIYLVTRLISLVVLVLLRIIDHSYQLAIKSHPKFSNFTKPASSHPKCRALLRPSLHPSIPVQGADPGDSASAVRSALRAGTAAAAAASRSSTVCKNRGFFFFVCLFRVFDTSNKYPLVN